MSTSTTWATAWPEGVIARYLTVGGAHVDLLRHKFRTRYTAQGRPFVSDQWREVDGFIWQCRGCDTRGGVGVFDDQYLPNERKQPTRTRTATPQPAARCPVPPADDRRPRLSAGP